MAARIALELRAPPSPDRPDTARKIGSIAPPARRHLQQVGRRLPWIVRPNLPHREPTRSIAKAACNAEC